MKQLITFTLCLFAYSAFSFETLSYNQVNELFEKASFPVLENHVESAISGRCIHKFNPEKNKASVMLVSLGEKGFEVAPVVVRDVPLDYFDFMTWKDVFEQHPEVNAQFFEVRGDAETIGLKLFKKELLGSSTGLIRESKNHYILKILKNNRFYRYCYYQKTY